MVDDGPWNDYKAPTAMPPIPEQQTQDGPWADYGPSPVIPQQPQQGVLGAVGEALKAQPAMTADALTNPVTQAKALPYLGAAAGLAVPFPGSASVGTTGGNLLADAALKAYGRSDEIPSTSQQVTQGVLAAAGDIIPPLIKVPESLKSAGINAQTLKNMAPGGQAPGDFAQAVEKQFQDNGVLANTANKTWTLMNNAKNEAGEASSEAMNIIKQEAQKIGGPDPLMIDANTAIQPLVDVVKQAGQKAYGATQAAATPFQEAANWLGTQAQQMGGKLNLDTVKTLMEETGERMNEGPEAEAIYGKVYGKLADVWDGMIHAVANSATTPVAREAASTLLENNANYSVYSRVLPAIEKAGYREAIREGISTFQKVGGPFITKLAAAKGIYSTLQEHINSIMGTQ